MEETNEIKRRILDAQSLQEECKMKDKEVKPNGRLDKRRHIEQMIEPTEESVENKDMKGFSGMIRKVSGKYMSLVREKR